jgi:hypothetical protein
MHLHCWNHTVHSAVGFPSKMVGVVREGSENLREDLQQNVVLELKISLYIIMPCIKISLYISTRNINTIKKWYQFNR